MSNNIFRVRRDTQIRNICWVGLAPYFFDGHVGHIGGLVGGRGEDLVGEGKGGEM